MNDEQRRHDMVRDQIASRGVRDERVLEAMRRVPRERFVPARVREFAYEDNALPIEAEQTISQPFIVALMAEALKLEPGDRVLEVGAGSGYAAAVMGEIAREVYAIERQPELAALAEQRMRELGFDNVHVMQGDGTLGWPEHAPFDAISVAAGGPRVAEPLTAQLAIGGRLVMPVGRSRRSQELVRVTRTGEDEFERVSLGEVRFVPLIGASGWTENEKPAREASGPLRPRPDGGPSTVDTVREHAEAFDPVEGGDLSPLLDRIGDARVVLIGESSHGTSEFYTKRAEITRRLIEHKGFNIVAIEGDWPDVSVIDRYVRGRAPLELPEPAFSRFPTWMWRNAETDAFVDWLRTRNEATGDPDAKAGMYGLDLYSLYSSIGAVLNYLDEADPEAAQAARVRYACFTPWETDPATYGRAAASGRLEGCADDAVRVLTDLLDKRLAAMRDNGDEFFDAERNATLVREAEKYYRVMYEGSRRSWNLRDTHMFDTLRAVLDHRGPESKAVVWAHNSHVGNAAATEMGARGEINIGQLCREHFGDDAYIIGFGTHTGTVAAADDWDGPVRFKEIVPSRDGSYERLCHDTGVPAFRLPLRGRPELREKLTEPRLERAIGVIYRPETELMSHYFHASLPAQFDEYIWFDTTDAVRPLEAAKVADMPETYPFGV